MKYEIVEEGIRIVGKDDFCPEHILECGQIFSFLKEAESCAVFSADKKAKIEETSEGFLILTKHKDYFVHFFDLETDYSAIKNNLSKHEILARPIQFGFGIRILKQDLFEVLISFIVSANNNIKRIQSILWKIREKFGSKVDDFYAFPSRQQLLKASEEDFVKLGAGYRAKYLYKVLREVDEMELQSWRDLSTPALRNRLILLSGVGPKVADCMLLFGYGRGDVFPVDTWIEKMFHKFYDNVEAGSSEIFESEKRDTKNLEKSKNTKKLVKNHEKSVKKLEKTAKNAPNREKIRNFLTNEFGELSGYAQQYLFFYMRAGEGE